MKCLCWKLPKQNQIAVLKDMLRCVALHGKRGSWTANNTKDKDIMV